MKDRTKCVYFYLHLKRGVTTDEQERYNAAVIAIAKELFLEKSGLYEGRETCIQDDDKGFDYKYPIANCYYVLYENLIDTNKYVNSVIKNFRLSRFVKFIITEPFVTSNIDVRKSELSKIKEYEWTWVR